MRLSSEIIDKNFVNIINNINDIDLVGNKLINNIKLNNYLSRDKFIELFTNQIITRHIDLKARELKRKNLGFYTIASAGHEGNVVFGDIFELTDIALLHYRSAAFMLQRANKKKLLREQIASQLLSVLASKYDPVCSGRHKVFGSYELNTPPQTSIIASHLPKALGLALALVYQKKYQLKLNNNNAVVLCSFGDASINHSTAQGAFNTIEWLSYQKLTLPLVLICEDNGWGISVKTPYGWVERVLQRYHNIKYIAVNGLDLRDLAKQTKIAVEYARRTRRPVFLHMKTVRLLGHAGSDIELKYRAEADIIAEELHDPVLTSAKIAVFEKILSSQSIVNLYEKIRKEINNTVENIFNKNHHRPLSVIQDIKHSLVPNISKKNNIFKLNWDINNNSKNSAKKINLAQAINQALADTLRLIPNSIIFGEDVGRQGGVYNITSGLQQKFGQHRVFDTLLDEQTILGTAIGFALGGYLPIPEIQFLAYIHNAIDQLRGEAATLSFFSNGKYANPMIIRLPSFAYQKGFGGHFHNENSIAFLREIPGIIIACPSKVKTAVYLWRECIKKAYFERRVCVFLEPIALYYTKDLLAKDDNNWLEEYPHDNNLIKLGEVSIKNLKKHQAKATVIDLGIISYGNGVYLAEQVAVILNKKFNLAIKIIDLNWLHPLPVKQLELAITKIKKIFLIDECRYTGSIAENLYGKLLAMGVNIKNLDYITAEDCFIPLGPASDSILPNKAKILNKLKRLLNL